MASSEDAFGISMDGRAPIGDIPAQARAAEEGGASTLWIACAVPWPLASVALARITAVRVASSCSTISICPLYDRDIGPIFIVTSAS